MIITCKPRISFLWMVLATLPWVAMLFKDKVMGAAFTLSMTKFVENPAALTFILSLPFFFNIIIGPIVHFLSDCIWTRIGRRKPFIIISWLGTIAAITAIPLATSFSGLLISYLVFAIFNQIGGPVEALKLEIVPAPQRGVSAAVLSWINQIAVIIYFWIALGRFDEAVTFLDRLVEGERSLFWMVSLGMVVMLGFLTLGIKEVYPHSGPRKGSFFGQVFRNLFSNRLWPVFLLACSSAFLGSSLGALNTLLTTVQWGYSNQQLGNNIAIGGVINLVLIPLLGLLASRMGRFNIYVALVLTSTLVSLSYFLYCTYILYDGRPTITEMVVFGEMSSVLGILISMAYVPLVYDFVPRNELGTYAAGSSLVSQFTGLATANVVGLFVLWYANTFLGPAGESVRVCFRDDLKQEQVDITLRSRTTWNDPIDSQGKANLDKPKVHAQPIYATGAKLNHGRGYEIRLEDRNSEKLRDQRDRDEAECKNCEAREKYARQQAEAATQKGRDATGLLKTVQDEKARADDLRKKVVVAEAELKRRSEVFRGQVEEALAQRLLRDGDQILDAQERKAVLVRFSLKDRLLREDLMRVDEQLRIQASDLIDLRVMPGTSEQERYVMELSLLWEGDPDTGGVRMAQVLRKVGEEETCLQEVMTMKGLKPSSCQAVTATCLDLRILEDPIDRHFSPINRAVDWALGDYLGKLDAGQRLRAVGRGLRRDDWIRHARATTVYGDERAIRVLAILETIPAEYTFDTRRQRTASTRLKPAGRPPDDSGNGNQEDKTASAAAVVAEPPSTTKPAAKPAGKPVVDRPTEAEKPGEGVLERLIRFGNPQSAQRQAALYSVAVRAAKEKRMTVARPLLDTGYAKQQWNYMIGYLAVFVLQMLGIGIIGIFVYMVKTGRVRRRGAEEAEATR